MNQHAMPVVVSAVLLGLGAARAQAAVVGEMDARLQVDLGCEVSNGSTADGRLNDFGVLDFGQTAPTWVNALAAELTGSGNAGTLEVTCSPGVASFSVSIDGGLRGNRTLLRNGGNTGTLADRVAYGLYRDAARTDAYAINLPQHYAIPNDGQAVPVPVFGTIPPNETAKSSGLFTDTLLVTIDL